MKASAFGGTRLETKTIMTAVRNTAHAATVVSALATTGDVGTWVRQPNRVFQSVVLRRFHELLVWSIAGMRCVTVAKLLSGRP